MKKTSKTTTAKARSPRAGARTISTPQETMSQPVISSSKTSRITEVAADQVRTRGPVKAAAPEVSIELFNPDARQVFVAGSFNGWKPETTPLQRLENGRWIGKLEVKPGRHEYLFVVDGQWLPDPNAKETVQNPFGGKNSVLSVAA